MEHTVIHQLMSALVAQAEQSPDGGLFGSIGGLIPFVLMFGVFYFLLIRPANKQRQDHASLLNQLKKGDEIALNGGIYGKIVALDEKVATVDIANNVKVRVLRERIAGKWPQSGTTGSDKESKDPKDKKEKSASK